MEAADTRTDDLETAPETAPAAERLLVQRTLFAGTSAIMNDELYAVVDAGNYSRTRFGLSLEGGATAHTNTFFGRFPASYWQRWTRATEVTVTLRVEAAARCAVQLVASDVGAHHRIIADVSVTAGETVELVAPLNRFADGGAVWLQFQAIGGPATVERIEWSVTHARPRRPASVAICTFNRARDCAETVAALASDERVLDALDAVYVVDQGTDIVADDPLFQQVEPAFGKRMRYIRQPNLGGAGGFSRGIYEAASENEHGDVLLMDDDILCEPETVLRLVAFANATTVPALIGAQMLLLYKPNYLLASAEQVDLTTLRRGLTHDKFGTRDANLLEELVERRTDAQYNGWWSCLVPLEVVRRIGMPLPVFFQWDDVEYSLRAGRAGVPTITLPGAGVWHADFYWKDVDGFAHYFSTRNGLITAALDPHFAHRELAKQLAREICHSIVSMQYGLAHTQLRAIEGFLEGPGALADGGVEALATITSERKRFHETETHPMSWLEPHVPIRRADPEPKEGWEDVILAKRSVSHARGRLEPGPVAVSFEDAKWWHVGRFEHVFVTDASQSGVRERRYDHALAKEMGVRLTQVVRRFRAEAPAVADDYRAAFDQLTSRENWARLCLRDTGR